MGEKLALHAQEGAMPQSPLTPEGVNLKASSGSEEGGPDLVWEQRKEDVEVREIHLPSGPGSAQGLWRFPLGSTVPTPWLTPKLTRAGGTRHYRNALCGLGVETPSAGALSPRENMESSPVGWVRHFNPACLLGPGCGEVVWSGQQGPVRPSEGSPASPCPGWSS